MQESNNMKNILFLNKFYAPKIVNVIMVQNKGLKVYSYLFLALL